MPGCDPAAGPGFTLIEFLISSAIVLIVAAAVFGILARIQRTAAHLAEVAETTENARVALETIERLLEQAGNDPHGIGFAAITIVSGEEARVRSDVTGSAGSVAPDKGDPDGDTEDANEDVTIRFVASSGSVEVAPQGGPAQPVASGLSAFSLEYFDRNGLAVNAGTDVCRIRISVTATSPHPDAQTGRVFSMKLSGDARIGCAGCRGNQ